MPAKRSGAKKQILYHKDGSVWAKGQTIKGVMTGYWEWFRKDGKESCRQGGSMSAEP